MKTKKAITLPILPTVNPSKKNLKESFDQLENMTQNLAKSTRRLRYAQLKAESPGIIRVCT